jgi:hypothetical protein
MAWVQGGTAADILKADVLNSAPGFGAVKKTLLDNEAHQPLAILDPDILEGDIRNGGTIAIKNANGVVTNVPVTLLQDIDVVKADV